MTLQDIRRLAEALGIEGADRLGVDKLIRLIQFQEGHVPCFSEAWSAPCGVSRCPFTTACSSHLNTRGTSRH